MRVRDRVIAAALAAGGAAGGSWLAVHKRDLRAIRSDPWNERLRRPLEGERLEVRSADGTALHVEVFGPEHGDPIVLIHGWTCSIRFWTLQIQDLAERHRVIAYDLRGHGRSERGADGDYSTAALAADVQAVLEAALPDGRPAVLAGHSMGAMSIMAWAEEHPEEVGRRAAAAALLNTGAEGLVEHSGLARLPSAFDRVRSAVGGVVLAARAPLPPASPLTMRAVRYVALCPDATPAQVAFCQELVLETPPDVRAACGKTLTEVDFAHAIESLHVPTLVLAGKRDRLTPVAHAERLADMLPDVHEMVELERVGHMAPIEASADVSRALDGLCRKAFAAGREGRLGEPHRHPAAMGS